MHKLAMNKTADKESVTRLTRDNEIIRQSQEKGDAWKANTKDPSMAEYVLTGLGGLAGGGLGLLTASLIHGKPRTRTKLLYALGGGALGAFGTWQAMQHTSWFTPTKDGYKGTLAQYLRAMERVEEGREVSPNTPGSETTLTPKGLEKNEVGKGLNIQAQNRHRTNLLGTPKENQDAWKRVEDYRVWQIQATQAERIAKNVEKRLQKLPSNATEEQRKAAANQAKQEVLQRDREHIQNIRKEIGESADKDFNTKANQWLLWRTDRNGVVHVNLPFMLGNYMHDPSKPIEERFYRPSGWQVTGGAIDLLAAGTGAYKSWKDNHDYMAEVLNLTSGETRQVQKDNALKELGQAKSALNIWEKDVADSAKKMSGQLKKMVDARVPELKQRVAQNTATIDSLKSTKFAVDPAKARQVIKTLSAENKRLLKTIAQMEAVAKKGVTPGKLIKARPPLQDEGKDLRREIKSKQNAVNSYARPFNGLRIAGSSLLWGLSSAGIRALLAGIFGAFNPNFNISSEEMEAAKTREKTFGVNK